VRRARKVSLASVVASLVAASFGLGIGYQSETLSLVGFGLEALLDGFSSALVLWRFKKPKVRMHEDEDAAARWKEARDIRRERNSGIGIGVTFVSSSGLLFCSAAYKLIAWDPRDPSHQGQDFNYAILLSLASAAVFGILAQRKFRLANALNSQVLRKDALCSVLGAILAFICAMAGFVEEASGNPESMMVVDCAASSLIAFILLVEGGRTLCHNLGSGWAEDHQQMA